MCSHACLWFAQQEDSQSGYLSVTLSFMIGKFVVTLFVRVTPEIASISKVSSQNVSNNARLDEVFTVFTNTIRNMLPPLATLIHYHLKFVNFYFELPAC